jgi:hypothetical protein
VRIGLMTAGIYRQASWMPAAAESP